MAMSRIEIRWAAVAAMVLPRRPGALPGSGADPDELMQALHLLRDLQSAPAHRWATVGLTLLMCAVYLAQDEAQAVTDGSERLRELGLSDLSARGTAVRGTDAEGAEYLGKAPSDEMVLVLDSRIKDERPPIPSFVALKSTVADVQDVFGTPDGDELDVLGAVGLVMRIDDLEARIAVCEQRLEWYQSYAYGASYILEERGTWEALSTRRRDALSALERSPVPETWSAPEIPRRLFQRISLGNPPLAMDMMQRVPSTIITEPPKPGELLDSYGQTA